MINGMMGDAVEKQTRKVAYSDTTYDFPASISFFDDAKKKSVFLRANMPLDEMLKIAVSIPVYDGPNFTVGEDTAHQQGQVDYPPPRPLYITPLKQFKSGISVSEISCKHDLQLIIKPRDNSPACVKEQTITKLVERGWGESAPIPEPMTGELRYGEQECEFIDERGESRSCIVSGWTKPASELDCEKVCAPPGTKE